MWSGASEAKIAATRGYGAAVDLEAADPGEAFRAARRPARGDRPDARPPVRRPVHDRGPGNGRAWRSSRTSPTWRRSSCRSAAAGSSPASPWRRPDAHASIGVEPEGSTAMHSALAAGERVEVTPTSIADGLNAPHAGAERARHRPGARREGRARHRGGDRDRASASCTSGRSSRASRRVQLPSPPSSPGKIEGGRVVCIVSGGNVAAETAAGILASR